MVPSKKFLHYSAAFILGMSVSATGTADTQVHRQGGSTSVVTQSGGGPTTTEVIKTPEGQKVITRSGNSVDITVQSSGPPPKGARGKVDETVDPERFSNRDDGPASKAPPAKKGNIPTGTKEEVRHSSEALPRNRTHIPTAEEFKERMRARMRPPVP